MVGNGCLGAWVIFFGPRLPGRGRSYDRFYGLLVGFACLGGAFLSPVLVSLVGLVYLDMDGYPVGNFRFMGIFR
jgi:hypothetical protein